MLTYILQTIAFQLVFLLIYDVFLKRETFFNWNRIYLLVTAISSVILPFIKIERFKEVVPQQFIIRLPEVVIGDIIEPVTTPLHISAVQTVEPLFVWHWSMLIYIGMVIAALLLIYKAIKISMIIYKNPRRWKGNVLLVNLLKSNAAFSIFHYICIGEQISDEDRATIFEHEVVHVQQKHTLDLLLFELLRIVFWFNPLVYMYQNRMSTLHEYIADAQAVKNDSKSQYYENLLSHVFDVKQFSFINPFFKQSLIKKRIVMLSKSKSNRIHLLKYVLLVPMVFGMLLYTSSYAQETKTTIENVSQEDDAHQDLTLQELVDKYYKEIFEFEKKEGTSVAMMEKFTINNEKYIMSKNELARSIAYMKFLGDLFIKKKSEDGTLTIEDQERFTNMGNKYETYEDYLAYQKTDEAISKWENQARNGEVRIVFKDFKNPTAEEKKRQQEKIDLILNDDYYHTLVTTSINGGGSKMSFDKPKSVEEIKIVDTYDVEVPFAVIDEVPTFSECESLTTNEEKKQCTSEVISKYVNSNFNTDLAKKLGLKGKQRISVIFKIDKQGNIKDVKSRAPHPELEKEAIRVIASLPKMTPGIHKGEAVIVPYSLPILFMVNDTNMSTVSDVKEEMQDTQELTEIPFSVVEEAPVFEGCETATTNALRKECTNDKISRFFNKNFNTNLAKKTGVKGQQRIMIVFKIASDGTIKDVKSRTSHPDLEKESIRVIKLLPKMIPGKQKGKTIDVSYSLPVLFQVQ